MKCIKENCRMPYMSGNTGFCHELETFIFGENPECPLPDKIMQMEKQLREYNCIMDKVIVFHAKNSDGKVIKLMNDAIQYKCPKCNKYEDAKLWDEETSKHYDESELKYVLSIETDDKNSCEFYCPNCKSFVNGKNIWIDVDEEKVGVTRILKISKIIVNILPKDCMSCTLHEDEYCKIKGNVTGSEWIDLYSDSRDGDCPLEVK